MNNTSSTSQGAPGPFGRMLEMCFRAHERDKYKHRAEAFELVATNLLLEKADREVAAKPKAVTAEASPIAERYRLAGQADELAATALDAERPGQEQDYRMRWSWLREHGCGDLTDKNGKEYLIPSFYTFQNYACKYKSELKKLEGVAESLEEKDGAGCVVQASEAF